MAGAVREALQSATTDGLWSAALLDLTTTAGDADAADRAVGRLTEVTGREPLLAGASADLGLAYHVRGAARGSVRDRFLALEHTLRAIRRDSTSSASWFSLAVLLDRVHLLGESIAAWQHVEEMGAPGEWTVEARSRMDGAKQRAAESVPALRDSVFISWLPSWATAVTRGDSSTAAEGLRRIELVGRELAARNRDSSVHHAFTAVVAAQRASADRIDILNGLSEYGRGSADFRAGRFEQAAEALGQAAAALRASGAPALWGWPAVELGAVEIYRHKYESADRAFRDIQSAAETSGDAALRARALWGEALSLARRGSVAESERRYVRAAGIYKDLNDARNEGVIRSQLAQLYTILGQPDRVLDEVGLALAAFESDRGSTYLHDLLTWLSTYLTELGLVEAALAVQREDALVAPRTGRAKDVPEARTRLARAAANAGRSAEAAHYITDARETLREVTDPLMRARLGADLSRAQADLDRDGDPALVVDQLDSARKYFEAQGISIELPPILVERARAYLRRGDTARAEADLADAVAMLNQRAASAPGPLASLSTLRSQADVFTELVTLQLARGDTAGALASAERARSDASVSSRVASKAAVAAEHIPRGRIVLAYLALRDRLLIWSLADDGIRLTAAAVADSNVAKQVERFVTLIRRRDDIKAVQGVAAELYDLVIGPVKDRLRGRTEVVIVTDRYLQEVPFAALLDRSSGRYLVQDASISFAPTVAAGAAMAAQASRPGRARTLVVGNPAFDRALFPGVQPLRAAEGEGDSVLRLYEGASLLSGSSATRNAFISQLHGVGLVHFAGHARTVSLAPERSHLVLAAAPGGLDANVLYASDIVRLNLSSVDLVVLSSCGSADGTVERGGPGSLAQAFGLAGARGVVTSLWEVDDAETTRLMTDFHRRLAEGLPVAAALRQAQVAAILAENDTQRGTGAWAAFKYEGR